MGHTFKLVSVLSLALSAPSFADSLTLSSRDITQGELMTKAQEYNGFGCSGGDVSPILNGLMHPKAQKVLLLPSMIPTLPQAAVGGIGKW